MGDQRDGGIAWCDETWNPIRGCSRVSAGCEHCYAERTAARFTRPGQAYEGLARITKGGEPQWTGEVKFLLDKLVEPLHWKRPRRVFVNSMSDVFHQKVSNDQICAIFAVMAASPRHTFQLLTKRPERMLDWFGWLAGHQRTSSITQTLLGCANSAVLAAHVAEERGLMGFSGTIGRAVQEATWPLRNVWLGVTAEDQAHADERVPLLMRTPAAKRFVSVEPQLGPVDLAPWLGDAYLGEPRLDWVITGAESGPGRRSYDLAWARSLRDQCADGMAAFFFKQNVDAATGKKYSTPVLDGRQWAEFPA